MSSGDILTKRDVAELLQVSERTVERWMAEGSIPYTPLPKRGAWSEAQFLRSEIVEWMRKRTVFAASTLTGAGIEDNIIGLLTGHKSRELRRYQHLREELKRKTVDLIAGGSKEGRRRRKQCT